MFQHSQFPIAKACIKPSVQIYQFNIERRIPRTQIEGKLFIDSAIYTNNRARHAI